MGEQLCADEDEGKSVLYCKISCVISTVSVPFRQPACEVKSILCDEESKHNSTFYHTPIV